MDDHYDPNSPKNEQPQDSRPSISYNRELENKEFGAEPEPSSPDKMYSRPHNSGPVDVAYQQPPRGGLNANGMSHNAIPMNEPVHLPPNTAITTKMEAAPDLLTRAFNEALRPYTDKIEVLEQQISDLRDWVEKLEAERREVHQWIDKRGLRPGE